MWILIEMIYPIRIEGRCAALDPVDLVSLGQKELRQVGAVLPGYSRYECPLSHVITMIPSYYSPCIAATAIATL